MKYHKTLKINLLSTNYDGNMKKIEPKIIMTNKNLFREMFAKKLDNYDRDYYDALIDMIKEYELSVDDIKLLIKNKFIEEKAINQLKELVSDKNLLNKKDKKRYKDLF